MTGSTRKRGKTWSYIIDIGKIDGKRKQKEKSGFATQKSAQAALTTALNELNTTGIYVESKKITFQELFEEFITNEANLTRKYPTIVRYKSLYNNHLYEPFASQYIFNISPQQIQKWLLTKTGTYSEEYVKSIFNLLLVIFGYALKMEYLMKSPLSKVTAPKNPRNVDDIEIYTKDDLLALNDRLSSTNLQPALQLGIHLGVRAGECYALRWSDFDLEKSIVVIDKQLQYQDKRWSFTTLKTHNSYRTISFGDNLKSYLLTLKQKQEEARNFLGEMYKTNLIVDTRQKQPIVINVDDFVNTKPDGSMLNTNSHKIISRIVKKEKLIDKDFKFHNIRHTHATILLESGINPKYIQERLGHSKLEFTLRLYTHVTRKMETEASESLDRYFE